MPISQKGKLSPGKDKGLLSMIPKLSKRHGPVASDSKATFCPRHLASPGPCLWATYPIHTVLRSQRLWILAVKAPAPTHTQALSLAVKLTTCLQDTGLGWHRLSARLSASAFSSHADLGWVRYGHIHGWFVLSPLQLREGVWSPEGHWVKVPKQTDRWPLASLPEGAVCWVKSSRASSPSPKQSWITTPTFQPQMFSCSQPGSKGGRPCRMEA